MGETMNPMKKQNTQKSTQASLSDNQAVSDAYWASRMDQVAKKVSERMREKEPVLTASSFIDREWPVEG